jgi:hypothetical protein
MYTDASLLRNEFSIDLFSVVYMHLFGILISIVGLLCEVETYKRVKDLL